MLTIDFEFHTLIAASTSLCHNHEKNSKNRVRTEFLRSTLVHALGSLQSQSCRKCGAGFFQLPFGWIAGNRKLEAAAKTSESTSASDTEPCGTATLQSWHGCLT
jgi:hypothetical protein